MPLKFGTTGCGMIGRSLVLASFCFNAPMWAVVDVRDDLYPHQMSAPAATKKVVNMKNEAIIENLWIVQFSFNLNQEELTKNPT
jgi:hypothetical protein